MFQVFHGRSQEDYMQATRALISIGNLFGQRRSHIWNDGCYFELKDCTPLCICTPKYGFVVFWYFDNYGFLLFLYACDFDNFYMHVILITMDFLLIQGKFKKLES